MNSIEKPSYNYDLIILFSGGADSAMLHDLAISSKRHPIYLMIDYEQLHKEELQYAKRLLEYCKSIQHSQTVKIQNLKINSGLTGDGEVNQYNNVHPFHVPSRNLMFISIAASIAEANNIDTIWYGADLSDRENLFPDCYQEWIIKVNELLKINGSKPIKLEAPLIGMTKDSILQYLKSRGYREEIIFSGYGNLDKN